jgi:hypothetical protein
MLTTLMGPYLRTGRLDEARDAHRRAYQRLWPSLHNLSSIADHIEFCARTGNEARAVEMVQRHLGWLDRAPTPWAEMFFAAASANALRRARRTRADLSVHRPAHGDRPAGAVAAEDLAQLLADQATTVAERFDRRNGTEAVGSLVRRMLDGPVWIDHLPLSSAPLRGRGKDA